MCIGRFFVPYVSCFLKATSLRPKRGKMPIVAYQNNAVRYELHRSGFYELGGSDMSQNNV